jgi:hypothetical protein
MKFQYALEEVKLLAHNFIDSCAYDFHTICLQEE